MGSVIQCFMLEPTDQAQEYLRRYAGVPDGEPLCPGRLKYHDAVVQLGPVELPRKNGSWGGQLWGGELTGIDHADPRWPTQCSACGRAFAVDAFRQHGWHMLLRRSDTGELITLDQAPAGAMWFAPWYGESCRGPDGQCLVVRTPAGDWMPDAPSSDGTPWSRTGTAPHFTCRPSILIYDRDNRPGYHGFLTAGRLEEC